MERGRLARGRARGGEVVPASRAAGARLGTGLAALALAGGCAAWLALASDHEAARQLGAATGGAAVALLAGGLALRLSVTVPLAVALLGLEYALVLAVDGGALDTRAPFVAAALFAVAELAHFSLELRDAVADEPGTYLRRLSLVSALAVAAVALGLGLLALVEVVGRDGGAVLQLAGALAAVAALALLARAARDARADATERRG